MTGMQDVRTELGRIEKLIGRMSGAAVLVLFLLFAVISIDGAVIASGQVTVQGNPRPVQSLDGGIVSDIHVQDGDTVDAGEVLLRLDPTLAEINRSIVQGRLSELIARQARLLAEQQEAGDLQPVAPPSFLDTAMLENHLKGQRDILRSRREVLASRKAQLQERINQYEAQISGIEAQITSGERQVAVVTREMVNQKTLNDKGLAPERRLLELQSQEAALLGQIAQHRAELASIRNAIRDAQLKIVQTEQEFREKAVTELREVTAKIDENMLEMARVDETLARLDIRAPVSGVVHEMQVWTGGGVVPPKETILTVIPVSDGVEFELQVTPDAIDSVYVGQVARVRFPTFNQRTTPELTGAISHVSPDIVTDRATGRTFYRVDVTLPAEELARLGEAELIPGMPIEAFLQTGERSVLSFLVRPLTDHILHAFRET